MTTEQDTDIKGIDVERRSVPREQGASKEVVVWLDSKTSRQGKVVDESLRGIGLEFAERLPTKPSLHQEVLISYNGVQLRARVRHIGRTNAGQSRIGFEWTAKGFYRSLQTSGTNSTADFFETLPCGLFVMLEFFKNDKWFELGETAERLQSLADRCGIGAVNHSVQQLLDAIELPHPREPSRRALRSLIEHCVQLKVITTREAEHQDDEVADGVLDEGADEVLDEISLVGSLLQSIEKTTNEVTVESLAEGLRAIMPNVPQNATETVFCQVVDAIHETDSMFTVQSLASTLPVITDRLPAEAAETAFQRIVSTLDKVDDVDSIRNLDSALNSVAEKLPSEAAERIFDEIISSCQDVHEDEDAPETLTSVLQTVTDRLSGEATERVVPRLISAIQHSRNRCVLHSLTQALELLTDKLPSQHIQKIFHQIVFALEQTSDDYALQCLAQALSSVTERLPSI